MSRKYIIVSGVVILVLLLLRIASGPMNKLEQGLLDVQYHMRGQVPADTNIVILYFDNDDISSLGGFPLKRNIYALLIDVLRRSNAKVIAFDILFGEPNLEYPEHDELLAAKAASSGRVVCSSYFGRVDTKELSSPTLAPDQFPALGRMPRPVFYGVQLQLPYRELLQAAAGIGHLNTTDGSPSELPLLFDANGRTVPAFGLEVLRVFAAVDGSRVRLDDHEVSLPASAGAITVPMNGDGTTSLNFPGPLNSFRHYSCVDVLRSFSGDSTSLSGLQGKIVFVSVIGVGRGNFVATPFDTQFPAVGLHATLIDNALQGRFLKRVSPIVGKVLIPLLLSCILILLIHRFGYFRGGVFGVLLAILYITSAQLAFVAGHVVLPIVSPVMMLAVAWLGPVLYDYFVVGKHVARLESEKVKIESKLREGELKLQMLEKELFDQKSTDSSPRSSELLDEINRYKEEIKTLSAQVSDMVEFEAVEPEPSSGASVFGGIVYDKSGKMKDAVGLIEKISVSDANVLILGESGTGKELVARAVHDLSSRKGKVFVAVNCGALTETLLESELFGHERGSFTGAVKEKIGRFEHANGGTIFLDEIGETSEAFQVKLLRIVQSGEFERVGSTVAMKTDARIIAATNKNLRDLVAAKRFREDLYYRLNVFSIELPALRERKGDIPYLAAYFVKKEEGSLSLSSTVMDAFIQYRWPGNVRELQSAITRAGILARSERRTLIQLRDVSEEIASSVKGRVDIEDQIIEILRSKRFSRSSISETAEELGGLNRGTVAEYFRGICFKHFFESSWSEEKAIDAIVREGDPESREKVQKKLREYLANVVEGVSAGQNFEGLRQSLRPKYKNLPQRYHTILDEVVRSYLDGRWRL
ncbi:MAG: sigma 54-interacting transcriptional regulator [Ignavibacteriales bacterium]|nr:sigma 54-interacting transcriptional regulator [Ignavibacteriales bacterium]